MGRKTVNRVSENYHPGHGKYMKTTIDKKYIGNTRHGMNKVMENTDVHIDDNSDNTTTSQEQENYNNIKFNLGAKSKLNDVKPNPLHRYASYTCKWTLSGLTESQIKNPSSFDPPHDIIARTGGIGTTTGFAEAPDVVSSGNPNEDASESAAQKRNAIEIGESANKTLRKNHDIYFEKIVMLSVPTPNPDRKLMNFTKIEFELSEPLGISLYEKLRAAAYNGGYLDHLDAPFLLTLEYGGFNSKGEPLASLPRRYFPIKIVDSQVDINQGGSRYTMTAVPWTEFGMVNRFLYLRGPLKVYGTTLTSQFKSIVKGIDDIQETEKQNGVRYHKDEYQITIHPYFVADSSYKMATEDKDMTLWNIGDFTTEDTKEDKKQFKKRSTHPLSRGRAKRVELEDKKHTQMELRDGDSIAKAIENIMLRTDAYKDIAENFIKKYWNKGFGSGEKNMVPWFKIISTVYTTDTKAGWDHITMMQKKTIRYHVQPYLVHFLNFVVPGVNAGGNLELYKKSVKKNYHYIFTGENLDILDLNIHYKYAYFQSRLFNSSAAVTGQGSQQLEEYETAKRTYGTGKNIEDFRSSPGEGFTVDPNSRDTSDFYNSAETRQFYDYLTNPTADMMKVDMQIMGDPGFVGHDFAIPLPWAEETGITDGVGVFASEKVGSMIGLEWDDELGAFNFDQSEPLVTLDFKFPTDINEKSGFYNLNSEEGILFAGLYKVVQVDSTWDQGKFTQDLTMVRLKNQNGNASQVVVTAPADAPKRNHHETAAEANAKDIKKIIENQVLESDYKDKFGVATDFSDRHLAGQERTENIKSKYYNWKRR